MIEWIFFKWSIHTTLAAKCTITSMKCHFHDKGQQALKFGAWFTLSSESSKTCVIAIPEVQYNSRWAQTLNTSISAIQNKIHIIKRLSLPTSQDGLALAFDSNYFCLHKQTTSGPSPPLQRQAILNWTYTYWHSSTARGPYP